MAVRWNNIAVMKIGEMSSFLSIAGRFHVAAFLFLFVFSAMLASTLALGQTGSEQPVYTLDAGDKLKVTVFGEEELSGEFEVDGAGFLAMPLIGEVEARGLSLRGMEKRVVEKLKNGFLKAPRVNVEVLNYRPFYILGEVKKPGSFPYVDGMTVVMAVALAGGFTYRAKKSDIIITRAHDPKRTKRKAQIETVVLPGDIITVKERFF